MPTDQDVTALSAFFRGATIAPWLRSFLQSRDPNAAALALVLRANNHIRDYVTGTFTPTLTFATPGDLAVTYSVRDGSYTQLARLVCVTFNILTSAFTWTTAAGNAQITGLPIAAGNNAGRNFTGVLSWRGITKASYTQFCASILPGASQAVLIASGSGQATANVVAADMPTAGTVELRCTMQYETS